MSETVGILRCLICVIPIASFRFIKTKLEWWTAKKQGLNNKQTTTQLGILAGYGAVITRKLWEASGLSGLDLSGIPSESQPRNLHQDYSPAGINSNLVELWDEGAKEGVGAMEM